jgi:hypothetical protein
MAFIARRAMTTGDIPPAGLLALLLELLLSARNEPMDEADAGLLFAGVIESGQVLEPAENCPP